jgi:hypothetical protein
MAYRTMIHWRISTTVLLLALAGGCREQAEQQPAAAQEEHTQTTTGGELVETPSLTFRLPAGWERRSPSSNMRLAEATIPGPAGAGELAVFHFGAGQGGSVDANLRRWIAQMDTDPGTTPEQASFESNGLKVTWVDVRGTLRPSSMGMGPKADQPGYRLIGAVVEGSGGPWFFKATGPDATLEPRRAELLDMLRNAHAKQ